MSTRDFLAKVVPAGYVIYVASPFVSKKTNANSMWHEAFTDYDLAAQACLKKKGACYFGVAGYTNALVRRKFKGGTEKDLPDRTIRNVGGIQVFAIDLDAGGRDFETHEEAAAEWLKTRDLLGLPEENLIVNSGGGWQIYYIIDTVLPPQQWEPLANAFKAALLKAGLRIDKAVTADACRVMRVPGTRNPKRGNALVQWWEVNEEPVPLSVWRDLMKPHMMGLAASSSVVRHMPEGKPSSKFGASPSTVEEFTAGVDDQPIFMRRIVPECGVMEHFLDTAGADIGYDPWKDMINLTAYCQDGTEYAHRMSSGYPSYSQGTVDAKLAGVDTAKGPTRCATFATHFGGICALCPHNGTIKSPIVLGREVDDIITPAGYKLLNGIVEKSYETEDGSIKFKQVCPNYRIENIKLTQHDAEKHHYLEFEYKTASDKAAHTIQVPMLELNDEKVFGNRLYNAGLVLSDALAGKELFKFMRSFAEQLRARRLTVQVSDTAYGWNDDPMGGLQFAIGSVAVRPDGSEARRGTPQSVSKIIGDFTPKGSYDAWKRAARAVIENTSPAHWALLATAFASPLMRFIGQEEVAVLSATSQRGSGYGKTTVVSIGAAVWAKPVHLTVSANDTPNYVVTKTSVFGGLPVYWDELANNDPAMSGLIFELVSGRSKGRLTNTAEMRMVSNLETIMCVTSNRSLAEIMESERDTAGLMRVLEFDVPRFQTKVSSSILSVKDDYGHAGPDYMRRLVPLQAALRKGIIDQRAQIEADLNPSNDERFWIAGITTLLAAAKLAKRFDIVPFDIPVFQAWLYDVYRIAKRNRYRNTTRQPEALLLRYIEENSTVSASVVTDDMPPLVVGITPSYGNVKGPRSNNFRMWHNQTDDRVRIPRTALMSYFKEAGGSGHATIKYLVDAGLLAQIGQATVPGEFGSLGRIRLYEVKRDMLAAAVEAIQNPGDL